MVAGIALAVLKPWAALDEPVPTGRPAASPSAVAIVSPAPPTATAAPTATPMPTPRDPRGFRCLGGRHWTLVTDEVQGPRELRSWIRIDPLIGATGPDDPAMPWTRVGADAVRAIGVCLPGAPSIPGATPAPEVAGTTIVVLRRGPALPGREPWAEAPVVAWAGAMEAEGGAMVAPASGSSSPPTVGEPWAIGDYVVEVRPGYVGPSAWFGLRVAGPSAGSLPGDGSTTATPGALATDGP